MKGAGQEGLEGSSQGHGWAQLPGASLVWNTLCGPGNVPLHGLQRAGVRTCTPIGASTTEVGAICPPGEFSGRKQKIRISVLACLE